MRAFIAVDFCKETKDKLFCAANELKALSIKGSFTRHENFHLTLAFLGEISLGETEKAKDILNKTEARPFELIISGSGIFKRPGGDIFWIGIQNPAEIEELCMRLRKELISNGFKIDDKKFSPHITLGREILLKDNSIWDLKINATEKVNKISLMKSERINGKLVYTEVFAKQL